MQLGIDRPVAQLLFRRHIRQLAEDFLIGCLQGKDLHPLPALGIPVAPDPEVRINQEQRFAGQVLKFQVPGRVIGRDVGNRRHTVPLQPLPGEVIVQIGDSPSIPSTAAEFSDIVAQRCGAAQGDIHRDPRLQRLPSHMHRHMVHTDGMRCRVEGHDLPPDAHELDKIIVLHRLPEASGFLGDAALLQLRLCHGVNVRQGIKGAVLPADGIAQQTQIKYCRLPLPRRHRAMTRLREHFLANLLI